LSGFKLSDADSVRHVFAEGTILPPLEAVVVFGGGKPSGSFGNAAENRLVFVASSGGLSLNNGGDTIRLEDGSGAVVQEIRYGAAEGGANQSVNRDPDADGAVFSPHSGLKNAGGRLFSPGTRVNGEGFTIQPRIRGLAPDSVRAGNPAFELIVRGERFLPDAVIMFGAIELETTYVSDSELIARVVAAQIMEGGAVDIRVRNPKGELSGSIRFLITSDPPNIRAVDPQVIGTGASSVQVSIKGERFQRGAVVQVSSQSAPTSFIASDSLTASLPDALFLNASKLTLSVVNADGNRSNQVDLTVQNGPLITRLSRSKLKAGRGDVELTVGGVGFRNGVTLYVDGNPVSTRFVDESSIVVVIPAALTGTPGRLALQARNPDGGRSNTASLKII
jgi:IPT/TIG domain-containing protein